MITGRITYEVAVKLAMISSEKKDKPVVMFYENDRMIMREAQSPAMARIPHGFLNPVKAVCYQGRCVNVSVCGV